MNSVSNPIRNQKGQTLIEYLIIVALVGVGSIALMRVVGQNINHKFAGVVEALGGTVQKSQSAATVTEAMYKKKDMKNFVRGSVPNRKGSEDDSSGAD